VVAGLCTRWKAEEVGRGRRVTGCLCVRGYVRVCGMMRCVCVPRVCVYVCVCATCVYAVCVCVWAPQLQSLRGLDLPVAEMAIHAFHIVGGT
jgi:hypothetical protein